jgi:hypothetical protein
MKKNANNLIRKSVIILIFMVSFFPFLSASADIAPPETPPGADIAPGDETTQVRMMAETVTMTILDRVPESQLGQAATQAVFTMRNLGDTREQMEVRFPLTFWNGQSDGFFNYPEIRDFQAIVNGNVAGTRRVKTPNSYDPDDPDVPWAAFEVVFPPGEDVTIEVKYTADGYGDLGSPFVVFRYVLQTGAGWKDTIGSADIIVRFPYEVNDQNVLLSGSPGFGETSPGAVLSGNEVRWHDEDFEPAWEHDVEIVIISPATWNRVLREQRNVAEDPEDGEAWGRLGLAYKDIIRFRRGTRQDPGGLSAYDLSVQAYENAVTLLPDDALWHYGFADLLWTRFAWDLSYQGGEEAQSTLVRALEELNTSLALDPDGELALTLADEMHWWMPEFVDLVGDQYIFLALTATPAMPTSTPWPTETQTPTETPVVIEEESISSDTPEPTVKPVLSEVEGPTTTTAPPATTEDVVAKEIPETSSSPLCGGALILPLFAGIFWIASRKRW